MKAIFIGSHIITSNPLVKHKIKFKSQIINCLLYKQDEKKSFIKNCIIRPTILFKMKENKESLLKLYMGIKLKKDIKSNQRKSLKMFNKADISNPFCFLQDIRFDDKKLQFLLEILKSNEKHCRRLAMEDFEGFECLHKSFSGYERFSTAFFCFKKHYNMFIENNKEKCFDISEIINFFNELKINEEFKREILRDLNNFRIFNVIGSTTENKILNRIEKDYSRMKHELINNTLTFEPMLELPFFIEHRIYNAYGDCQTKKDYENFEMLLKEFQPVSTYEKCIKQYFTKKLRKILKNKFKKK